MKRTDWSRTPIYYQFLRNGRWMHEDSSIYSEIELKYLFSALQGMLNAENKEEFMKVEGVRIVNKHSKKTLNTLEILLQQLNMMYYWVRLKVYFDEHNPTLEQLAKLMQRCVKLYMMIDTFMKIFMLISKKEDRDAKRKPPQEEDLVLTKRLQVAIKLLLKENTMLPTGFLFKEHCLLERLKKEQRFQSMYLLKEKKRQIEE
mmetsp:Transcript_8523/g.13124  ORF Transcript_8523/g.13124 Transcript_8523/m.13124 type:complete len:202 (-) Transcript_8523:47-652(-)